MTIGFGALSLPPSLAVLPGPVEELFDASGESGSGSAIVSARCFESGDHSYACRRPFASVSWNASPPRRSSSQTWLPFALPGRDEVNDRYLPSGLNRGLDSLSLLDVSWRSF